MLYIDRPSETLQVETKGRPTSSKLTLAVRTMPSLQEVQEIPEQSVSDATASAAPDVRIVLVNKIEVFIIILLLTVTNYTFTNTCLILFTLTIRFI